MGNENQAVSFHPSPITHPPAPKFRALPPLSLYVHIPWCARKCPYCDFNSHEARGELPESEYIAALIADLEQALPLVWGRRVHSVFFGGGTPSLFSAPGIDAVLAAVRARLPLAGDAEITLEANPGSAEAAKFQAFRAAGVNRLSLGIQSFENRHLKALGRIHDSREAHAAIDLAQRHFDNVHLDLIYGLPSAGVEDALADIEAAIACRPQHISAYHLTIEPNTYFHRYPPSLPDDDVTAAMQEGIEDSLAAAGYEHYETSAFAKSGAPAGGSDGLPPTPHALRLSVSPARCRHNLNYWLCGDSLGIGAGAHGKLSFPDRILRDVRWRQPRQYMESALHGRAVQETREVGTHEVGFEFMMNALRLNEGFPVSLFEERAGVPLTAVLQPLDEAERRGLIARDHQHIAPTALGRRFLNDLLQLFLATSKDDAKA